MKYLIYTLSDPITNEVRYVGQTTRSLKARLNDHIRGAKHQQSKKTSHKNNWINKILKTGMKPIITFLDEADETSWKDKERKYISEYKTNGIRLLNVSDGGDSGSMPGNKRIWSSEEAYLLWKEKTTQANKNKLITEETRKKMAENAKTTHTNKKRSDETRIKLSEGKKGEKNPMFGKKASEETKMKLSISRTGKKNSFETIQKIKKNQPQKKKVKQISKDGKTVKIYDSISEAEISTGCRNIYKVLNGTTKTCGGFIWKLHENNC